MNCTVIIPCCDEAENLPRSIPAARAALGNCEIIVVDGGSSDPSVQIAQSLGGAVVASAVRQRAAQMNLGADKAMGDLLLFLHADTLLPAAAGNSLRKAMDCGELAGGGFARRFDSSSPFLRFTCALAEARCRAFGWFLGDQVIFARRKVFQELGGFRRMNQFEDLDFCRRMKQLGRVVTLRPPVVSSARRFDSLGPLRRTWRDLVLTCRYLHGNANAV